MVKPTRVALRMQYCFKRFEKPLSMENVLNMQQGLDAKDLAEITGVLLGAFTFIWGLSALTTNSPDAANAKERYIRAIGLLFASMLITLGGKNAPIEVGKKVTEQPPKTSSDTPK